GDDGVLEWGGPTGAGGCAHKHERISCIACHSSWNPSCFGCHLPQKVNTKSPGLHYEGDVSRNYVAYNIQTLRDDVFMLARDGNATGNRIGPSRSSCAIHVGSYNNNRESIYVQQQTISAEGFSGIAFSTNVPHTVRGGPHSSVPRDLTAYRPGTHETKMCSDCHVSKYDDNNAIMAQLLMQGTNYTNFIGKYCWVGLGSGGLAGVVVTEQQEPQTVIGSSFHRIAYPDDFGKHVANSGVLQKAHHHGPADAVTLALTPLRQHEVLQVQMRGEYLYAACGADGLRVFDIAFIDDKAFSQRITTAPVSPLGQQFYVKTPYATGVAAPSTTAPDPTRTHNPDNFEGSVHAMYGYLYVSDREEGLVMVGAGTLLDGNPLNNFLKKEVSFNPEGILNGASGITIAGTRAWICCDAGVVIVSIEDPTCPQVVSVIGSPHVTRPTSVEIQFRNAFVCDAEGLKTFDITDPTKPVPLATVPLANAHKVYVARTYAYVAAGPEGLVIVDVTKPHEPFVDQVFNADGTMCDVRDVKLGITYVSEFAYVADGANGLRVVQLTGPDTPGNAGFSPRPTPQLVATYPVTKGGLAVSVSEGVDRDRAVDETGNQLSVFGRVGAKPLDLESQQRMYLRKGRLWKASDNPFDTELYRQVR
ncbi:MAG: LVIVD repeat-containing protein, partial [Planctomycetia bacterium]